MNQKNINNFEEIINKQYKINTQNIINEINNYDKQWKANNKQKYIFHSKRKRQILTEFGLIKFSRNVYKYYDDKKSKISFYKPVDAYFGFEANQHLHPYLKQRILDQLVFGKRYRDIIEDCKRSGAKLNKPLLSRLLKTANLEDYDKKVSAKVELKKDQIVYINTDDSWVPVVDLDKKKRKIKVRVTSFNLGYKENVRHRERKELKDKRIFFIVGDTIINSQNFPEKIKEMGSIFYKNFDQTNLVLGGDGATWIRNAAKKIGASYVLDKYHSVRHLLNVWKINPYRPKRNENNYQNFLNCKRAFESGNVNKLLELLETACSNDSATKYFKNNAKGVENFGKDWNIGVSAETDIARLVKAILGNKKKVYSIVSLKNLLGYRSFKINNNLMH